MSRTPMSQVIPYAPGTTLTANLLDQICANLALQSDIALLQAAIIASGSNVQIIGNLTAGATIVSTLVTSGNSTVGGTLNVSTTAAASGALTVNASSAGLAFLIASSQGTSTIALSANNSGVAFQGLPTGAVGITTGGFSPIVVVMQGVEKARIDPSSSGLLIGYTASNGAFKLQVNSQIFATSATVATSDAKFKTNVVPLASALDLILTLRPSEFEFVPDDVHNFPTGRQVGFIAQDVQSALAGTDYLNSLVFENTREEQPAVDARDAVPEQPAVLDEDGNVVTPAIPAQDAVAAQPAIPGDTFLGLADAGFTPLVVKALQELAAQVADLKTQVAALQRT